MFSSHAALGIKQSDHYVKHLNSIRLFCENIIYVHKG